MEVNLTVIEKAFQDTSDENLINTLVKDDYLVSVSSPLNELQEIKTKRYLLPLMALEIQRRDIIQSVRGIRRQKSVKALVAKYVLLASSGD